MPGTVGWNPVEVPYPGGVHGGCDLPTGRVLVTGAGGAAGVAVIQALSARAVPTVAVDADPAAVGLRLADDRSVVPPAHHPDFAEAVADIAARTGAGALVATVAEELPALARATDRLAAAGLATWLPDPAAVDRCLDKWCFAQVAAHAGVPVPPTALGDAGDVPGPWIVKPRRGRGSRHVTAADDAAELAAALVLVPDPIVQTRAGGREFTADALVARGGALAGLVARWRLDTKGGISTRGETFVHPAVTEHVTAVLDAVGLEGPANVQGFVDEDGTVLLTEVNPRFSGGLPLSLAAGADLVGEYLRGIAGLPLRPDRLRATPGVRMYRHFAEIFEAPGTP